MKYKQEKPQVKSVGFGNNFHHRNEIGLSTAYSAKNKLFVKDDTMYIAGTSNLQDAFDDLKIPFGLTRFSQRYQDANNLLKTNPQVNHIIGHSLGGSVGLELEQRHPEKTLDTITYGAPVLQYSNDKHLRFRHPSDPISAFDNGSLTLGKGSFNLLQNHAYTKY